MFLILILYSLFFLAFSLYSFSSPYAFFSIYLSFFFFLPLLFFTSLVFLQSSSQVFSLSIFVLSVPVIVSLRFPILFTCCPSSVAPLGFFHFLNFVSTLSFSLNLSNFFFSLLFLFSLPLSFAFFSFFLSVSLFPQTISSPQ